MHILQSKAAKHYDEELPGNSHNRRRRSGSNKDFAGPAGGSCKLVVENKNWRIAGLGLSWSWPWRRSSRISVAKVCTLQKPSQPAEMESISKKRNAKLEIENKDGDAKQDVPVAGPRPDLPIKISKNSRDKYMLRAHTNMRPSNLPKHLEGEQVAAGWPSWLSSIAGEALVGWIPRRANTFEKLSKVGQGTYSNVYKARDLDSGKVVALKKVKFDNLEPESVRFMLREIKILRRLDHPNIIKLEGVVTSRMSCSLYLVFEYMEHDLAGLVSSSETSFTEAQVKCVFKQLLLGLDHCHKSHVMHRDIKGSNLLLDGKGNLKIADFGLASFFDPVQMQAMTSRVVTLWYRPPELLLGATMYGVAIDMWSAGCILAELFASKPIMPGRTEFFKTKPFACDPSNLPKFPPSKEYDARQRLEEARRQAEFQGKFGENIVLGDSKQENTKWREVEKLSQIKRVSNMLTKSKSTGFALGGDQSVEMEATLHQANTGKAGLGFFASSPVMLGKMEDTDRSVTKSGPMPIDNTSRLMTLWKHKKILQHEDDVLMAPSHPLSKDLRSLSVHYLPVRQSSNER